MKEFFEREEIEKTNDPKLREVQMYLGEYQRQTSIQNIKVYIPFFAALVASALISRSCESTRQNLPAHNEPENSGQTVLK